jgi:transposase, IS5 family
MERVVPWSALATGTIVDAVLAKAGIIAAPSSTKSAQKARDPEMHQTKKGNHWYFGIKAHLGVDSRTKLIHAAVVTPANVARQHRLARSVAWQRNPRVGRSGRSRPAGGDPPARSKGERLHQSPLPFPRRGGRGRAGEKPHQVEGAGQEPALAKAGVEHSIGIIKRVFGFAKSPPLA